jgi:hypothetical protein
MADHRINTTIGAATGLTATAIEQFKSSLRGGLLCPGDAHYDSARALHNGMLPFASGGLYVHYEADHDVDRVKAAYSPTKYARLVAVKAKYDPTNLFRLNQNIKPVG